MGAELLTCTGVFLCESKGGMRGGRSLKLIPPVHWQPLALKATEFRQTQNKGSKPVRGGAAPCGEPELEQLLALPPKRRRSPLFWWHLTPLLQRASSFSAVPSCFSSLFLFIMAWAASSSTNPQEALHSLIICTSNQGRHRDADHKFRPPPHHSGVIVLQQLPLIGAVGSNC